MLLRAGLLALSASVFVSVRADVITQVPDAAPPGFEEWVSPIVCLYFSLYFRSESYPAQVIPAKNVSGDGDWSSAVTKARAFVAQLTLEEKVNLTTGIGINGRCVGNTGVGCILASTSLI